MSEVSKPHSMQDDLLTIRGALTMDRGTIIERRHTKGLEALARLEEQLEALRDAAERVVAADNQSLGAMGQEGERAFVEMTDALYALRVLIEASNPASEPKEDA